MDTKLKPTIPPDINSFFLKPPILESENLMEYKMVFEALANSIRPTNPVEWLLRREVTNLFWDERRLEKLKAAMINTTWQQALVMILESILEGDANERRRAAEVHAETWFKSEEAQRAIANLLCARPHAG